MIAVGLAALFASSGCTSSAKVPSGSGGDSNSTDAAGDGPSRGEGGSPLPAVPLHTQSRWIMDADNHRFKLAGVSWYGGESEDLVPLGLDHADVDAIAALIKRFGFNSVRIPWALQMFEQNPVVAAPLLSANPALQGKTALEVLDAVIDALARQGLVVILDNHRSRGDWCCDTYHGDGLWHTAQYPESNWIADWQGMVDRYKSQPAVVAADLRNEIRGEVPDDAVGCVDCDNPADAGCACLQPSWGDNNPLSDWAAAAERGGNAVLERNPNLLVIVEGNFWATWFGASYRPVHLAVANRLVWSPHNYTSSNGGVASFANYAAFKTKLDSDWGYLVTEGQPYTAPVWLGEFGTNHTSPSPVWWPWIEQYITEKDLDWSFWALNGTQGKGYGRTFGAVETFGVLDTQWADAASASFLAALQALIPSTTGP
jgi:endoglucanase